MEYADFSQQTIEQAATALRTDIARGLTTPEAATRLQRHGTNVIEETPGMASWKKFLHQFADPLTYLLLVAIGIALGVWYLEGRNGPPFDALAIGAIVITNAILGYLQQRKADSAVAALRKLTTSQSTVLRDGVLTQLPSTDLVPGDVIAFAEGDAISVDARLIEA